MVADVAEDCYPTGHHYTDLPDRVQHGAGLRSSSHRRYHVEDDDFNCV